MSKFNPGDQVRIVDSEQDAWNGFMATVVSIEGIDDSFYLEPHTDRPDGYGRARFWWYGSKLELLAAKPVVDQTIDKYAAELKRIYDERTAGDYTFNGVLASFLLEIQTSDVQLRQ